MGDPSVFSVSRRIPPVDTGALSDGPPHGRLDRLHGQDGWTRDLRVGRFALRAVAVRIESTTPRVAAGVAGSRLKARGGVGWRPSGTS